MAKWRNKVEIKNMFNDKTDDQTVLKILNVLIPQLESILTKERAIEGTNKASEELLDEFEEVIDNLKWVKECIETSENPEEYSFNSWCDALNGYLNDLYDVGDTAPDKVYRFGGEKFLWIN